VTRAWRLLALGAAASMLLAGCQAGAALLAQAPTPRVVPATETPNAAPPAAAPPTATLNVPPPSSTPTSQPTPQPTNTPIPSTPTPGPPTPTPDATQVVQKAYCDAAAPPAHVAMPPLEPFVRIPTPTTPTQPPPVSGGPRQEGTEPPPNVTARGIAVLDEASGALLYQRDPFLRAAPASIAKIVTTIVALEHMPDLSRVITTTVSATALAACDGSSLMGLEPNDRVRLDTLLYGMMLPSGNDAAEQVAFALGGSREVYVGWMNDKVSALGLHDTHFVTPSGMDADDQYSSAYDMAMLGRYAMQNPVFRTIAATPYFVGDEYYMHNLNGLLSSYPGADGVKIGYTEIAGRTIVGSVARDGHRVYVSLMGSRNLNGDSVALFEWVFKTFRW
jgi:D-alanyl-D-alanine carboxypeptidase